MESLDFILKDLQEQKDGLSDYLIAWHDGKPVGHILISWAGYNVELPSELTGGKGAGV